MLRGRRAETSLPVSESAVSSQQSQAMGVFRKRKLRHQHSSHLGLSCWPVHHQAAAAAVAAVLE